MEAVRLKRLFLVALITSLTATAALAIATLLLGAFDETAGRILATTALLSGFSLLALPAGILLDRGRGVALAWATIALAALGFLLSQWLVWFDPSGDGGWKLLGIVAAFAAASAQTCATTSRRRDDDPASVHALYLASIATAYTLALLATFAIVESIDGDGFYRFLGALAVANVLVGLLQPVLRRLAALPLERPAEPRAAAAGDAHAGQTVFRFRCTLHAYPDRLPPGDGYRPLEGDRPIVDCEIPARAFADALAHGVRELEAGGAHVVAMERAPGA